MNAFTRLPVALVLLTVASLAGAVTLPDYERVVLDNGTVLLLSEKHDVPLVGLSAVIRGGATADPADKYGLASQLAGLLSKGAGARDAATFAEAVEAVGGDLSARAELESISIQAEFLSRDAALMVELVADMIMRPTLDADEMAKLRDRSINLIRAAKDADPSALMPVYGSAFLFGEHPYGNPVGGSEASLAGITHEDVLEYYAGQVGGDRLIIAVVGDFDATAMQRLLTEAFGEWRAASAELADIEAPVQQNKRRVLLVDRPDTTQTYFWIGRQGVPVDYPGRAALNVANTIFGGSFTSMLMTALRVETGLSYSAYAMLARYAQAGYVAIRSFTETGTTIEAVDLALEVRGELRNAGVNEQGLVAARNYIMGQFPPRLETALQLAGQLTMLEQYGLGRDYIDGYGSALDALTTRDVNRAIDAVYASTDDLVFVMIGDAALIRDDVAKYGEVTEISITDPHFRLQKSPAEAGLD